MKTHLLPLATFATLAILATTQTFAHRGGHLPSAPPVSSLPAEPSVALPDTMTDTLAVIQRQLVLLQAALKESKYSAVSSNAVTFNQLVQHIVAQVPTGDQAAAKEVAKKHAKLTQELNGAAAAGASKSANNITSKLSRNLRMPSSSLADHNHGRLQNVPVSKCSGASLSL